MSLPFLSGHWMHTADEHPLCCRPFLIIWTEGYLGPLTRPSEIYPAAVAGLRPRDAALPPTYPAHPPPGNLASAVLTTPLTRDAMRLDGCAGTPSVAGESKRKVPTLLVGPRGARGKLAPAEAVPIPALRRDRHAHCFRSIRAATGCG